jgi:steroid delta-isomerase-like uncharacterized protein
MTQQDKALAERFHMDIFEAGRLDVADEILAPDFTIHSPGLPPELARGPEGTKQFAQAIRSGLPDLRITHDDVVAAGNKVVIRWTATGTHGGEMMGVPATGKQVTITGFDLFRIAGGKLAELWQNWDQLGFLQQVGAVPAAEGAPI